MTMKKIFTLILFYFSLCKLLSAQEISLFEDKFASRDYFYYYDKTDSVLHRFNNNYQGYSQQFKCQAKFNIYSNGFGFIQYTKSIKQPDGTFQDYFDSIYVSMDIIDNTHIINYYEIKNNEKSSLVCNSLMKSDTVQEYRNLLMSDRYTIPTLIISDVKSKKKLLEYKKGEVAWLSSDQIFLVDTTTHNNKLLRKAFNSLVLDNYQNTEPNKYKNACSVDLDFFSFYLEKREYKELVEKIKKEQMIHIKEKRAPIKFSKGEITNNIRENVFISQNLKPVILFESNNALVGSRNINNIFEMNDSLIKYTSLIYGKTLKTDTFSVSIEKIRDCKYVLNYNQFANESNSLNQLLNLPNIEKADTIIDIKTAIKDSIISIDLINVKVRNSDKSILKVDFSDNQISYKDTIISKADILVFRRAINQFIIKNASKEQKNKSHEVLIRWRPNGIKFYCSEKELTKLLKSIEKNIKTSR